MIDLSSQRTRARTALRAVAWILALGPAGLIAQPREAVRGDGSDAVVFSLSGTAEVQGSGAGAGRRVQLFDWIAPPSTLHVGPGSRLGLALPGGERYELMENAHATLLGGRLRVDAGSVRTLSRVPPLPRLYPLLDAPGTRPAAVRIRAGGLDGLYPDRGARVVADETVLRFTRPVETAAYEVEIEDDHGSVFRARVAVDLVSIPPGVLKPGARYDWRVRGPGPAGLPVDAESELVTLSEELARTRGALRDAVGRDGSASPLALLAEVDRRLGLLHEARVELAAASAKAPGDRAVTARLAEIDRELGAGSGR